MKTDNPLWARNIAMWALRESGWTFEQIAQAFGKSRSWVASILTTRADVSFMGREAPCLGGYSLSKKRAFFAERALPYRGVLSQSNRPLDIDTPEFWE